MSESPISWTTEKFLVPVEEILSDGTLSKEYSKKLIKELKLRKELRILNQRWVSYR